MNAAWPNTLPERVEAATARGGTVAFVRGAGEPERVEWARLHDDARAAAAGLQARGVAPGDRVAILGTTSRPLVTAIQAVWLAGAAAVVLPLPMRLGSLEEFVAQTRARVEGADARLVAVDADLVAFWDPRPGDPPVALLHELAAGTAPGRFEAPAPDPAALAILQFTSGSTADPKGVVLPHAQVAANLDAIAAGAALDPDADVLVSWLPLYHDMGLIGLLSLAMTTGTDLVLAAPSDFLAAPGRWMEWMSAFGGTATAGPNFSYALAARALPRLSGLDLSRWRVGLNGAEPVDPAAVEAFCAAGAPHGLDARSVFCAFGMAEATLAVTFPEPFSGMATDAVDRRVLEGDRYAAPVDPGFPGARRLARLGRPVAGMEVRVVDPTTGTLMAGREVGEVEVAGTSLTPGYYRRPDATAAAFRTDAAGTRWLRTGDLGYLVRGAEAPTLGAVEGAGAPTRGAVGGELVVCGRLKDVIIVGGRNVFPEDVERAAGSVEGVRAGNVIAFGVEGLSGKEGLVVVAEARPTSTAGSADAPSLRRAVTARVRQAVGLPPKDVVLVSPGTLPKTSSGKLQRSLCRTRYQGGELQPA